MSDDTHIIRPVTPVGYAEVYCGSARTNTLPAMFNASRALVWSPYSGQARAMSIQHGVQVRGGHKRRIT